MESKNAEFLTTHWSVVFMAGKSGQAGTQLALERLCAKYWYPIYAFVRRRGAGAHEAEDLTQAFFAHLLEHQALKDVDREKGRFRTFLLASLTNFLTNEWRKNQAIKRGGGHKIISLDETEAEGRYRLEPPELAAPDKLFERRWALMLLEQVLTRLKKEYISGGKAELFAQLEPLITGEITPGVYARLSAVLGMKEETVRVALSRTRRRFGEIMRHEIAQTVADPAEIDDEIRHLFTAISG